MKTKFLLSATMVFMCACLFGQAYPDRHSTSYTDNWASCEETDTPNPKRDAGHWIMYDLGDHYSLHRSTIWNYNVPDTTDRGARDIVIDYSNDGESWIELGEFTISEAPGSAFYEGDQGPNFEGIVARYVLVNILNSHGDNNCVGLSEFKIDGTITTYTNIPELELDLALSASPNPASTFTMINIGAFEGDLLYSLTDISGRVLREGKLTTGETKLNTTGLTNGTYTYTVYNEEGSKAILISIIN